MFRSRRIGLEALEGRYLLTIDYRLEGIDFSPYIAVGENPNLGDGQITDAELYQRIEQVAPYTKWIRTFGSNEDLKEAGQYAHALGLNAALGAWIGRDATANRAQIEGVIDQALQGHADMVIVGSESLLRGDVTPQQLVSYITEVRQRLHAGGIAVPVATADVYSQLLAHPEVIAACDVVLPNYYPFWEGIPLEQAVARVHRWHQQLVVAAGGKPVIVSETGWPSGGDPVGEAIPSPQNAAYYFQNFVSWARTENVRYFYFQSHDEGWKVNEGTRGITWGVLTADGTVKPGMERVFEGETLPDTWTNPPVGAPILDFFALPSRIETNLPSFVVAGTARPTDQVRVDGVVVPASAIDPTGAFSLAVPLVVGDNILTVTVEDTTGQVLKTDTRTIVHSPVLSTADRKLLYIDVVAGDAASPTLDGTVVVDLERNTVLGLLPGKHVRGISADGTEVYMHDNSVVSTASHQTIRILPFSLPIASSSFLVAPDGTRLYANSEAVDIATNTLVGSLPVDISTGSSWAGASLPGGPAISADGAVIFAGNSIRRVDVAGGTATNTGITGSLLSDIAISPDGGLLLLSEYSFSSGRLHIYDAHSFQLLATIPGLGDFAGEIAFLDDHTVVVGSAGNPLSGGGKLSLIDLTTRTLVQQITLPLADNVTVSPRTHEVFVSSGSSDEVAGKRLGVDVFTLGADGKLARARTFFLGINRFAATTGRPTYDQIRDLVFKPAPNRAPVLAPIGNWATSVDRELTFRVTATDGEGDTLAFSLEGAVPTGATIDPSSGLFRWTPTANQGPGTYTFTVRVQEVGNPTFFDEETITVSVEVPAPTTLTLSAPSLVYGQVGHVTVRVEASTGVPDGTVRLIYQDTSHPLTRSLTLGQATFDVSGLPVGTHALRVEYLGSAGFHPNNQTGTIQVTPARLAIVASAASKLYGMPLSPLAYSLTGLVNGDSPQSVLTGNLATLATAASHVGSYAITQGALRAGGNYQVEYTGANLTVTQASAIVRLQPAQRFYAQANPTFSATATGLVNGDTLDTLSLNFATPATPTSLPGSYEVTASNPNGDYTLTIVPAQLRIHAEPLHVYGVGRWLILEKRDGTRRSLQPYGRSARGGFHVASGDVDQDGYADALVAPAAGAAIVLPVKVYSGRTGELIRRFVPISGFRGGYFLASGDVLSRGYAQLILGVGQGGGPLVFVLDARLAGHPVLLRTLRVFDSRLYRGGVSVGASDGVLAAGAARGGTVVVYDGDNLARARMVRPFGGVSGVNVAARAGFLAVARAFGGSVVQVYDLASLTQRAFLATQSTPPRSGFPGGTRLAWSLTAAGEWELETATGPGWPAEVAWWTPETWKRRGRGAISPGLTGVWIG